MIACAELTEAAVKKVVLTAAILCLGTIAFTATWAEETARPADSDEHERRIVRDESLADKGMVFFTQNS